jgi:hypothetical protein
VQVMDVGRDGRLRDAPTGAKEGLRVERLRTLPVLGSILARGDF